ncbi:MAG: hypothetical protein AUJ20_03440 [Comamonadaceae bacterium CG1_02_60_18]|nr:MAG: hypothetical protein AUJ20_03440 [Comamonadaceae bacterium CG1_02_60_18]PIQ50630.1 MAG: DUF2191 domain-containing protein [Comamonadaceae bacterium CG12_big_fil_rev_8_21_14_0_65_59_15]
MNTRTNIVIDDDLIAQAMLRARVKTKKAAVEAALKAFVRKPNYAGLLALQGSNVLADDYDPDECYAQHPVEPLLACEPLPAKAITPNAGKNQ